MGGFGGILGVMAGILGGFWGSQGGWSWDPSPILGIPPMEAELDNAEAAPLPNNNNNGPWDPPPEPRAWGDPKIFECSRIKALAGGLGWVWGAGEDLHQVGNTPMGLRVDLGSQVDLRSQGGFGVDLGGFGRDAVQKKTFTKWVNAHLARAACRVGDLYSDLRDGFVLSGETLVRRPVRHLHHHHHHHHHLHDSMTIIMRIIIIIAIIISMTP
ncbi:hypothetical protein DV515_00019717, partial [Chloebia gouldiae]